LCDEAVTHWVKKAIVTVVVAVAVAGFQKLVV